MAYYLGLDSGGTNTKAALFDEGGREIVSASRDTAMLTPFPGYTARDMEEMYDSALSVIDEVVFKSAVDPAEILGLAICGHGKGLYLWGHDDYPVRSGIISTDNRAYEYPAKWQQDGTEKAAFALSMQHILPSQPVALLAWLRDNEPGVLEKTKWVFECKDYLRFRLTGEAFAERSDYSGAHLLNLSTGQYDQNLLALFGLADIFDKLPPLRNSFDLCGRITQEAAAKTGLLPGTPVAGGAFDIDACAIAAGVTNDEYICMIAGTWSINEYVSSAPVTDGRVLMNSLFCEAGRYLIEESSPTSAGNLEWFIRSLFPELRASLPDGDIYGLINSEVSSLSADEPCPIFLPFLLGSNVHPGARGSLIGLLGYHTRAHILRAVYEGVAFSHRFHFEKLMACRKTPPKAIRLAGGAARSQVWAQMFADVMGLPVEVIDANETGALGCAVIASVAAGRNKTLDEAVAKMCRIGGRYDPNSAAIEAYDKKYMLYTKATESLNGFWDALAASERR